jgi:hypothetical protein
LIQLLIENKATHLTKIDLTNCGSNTIYVKNIDYGNNLDYSEKDIRKCEDKPMRKPTIFNIKQQKESKKKTKLKEEFSNYLCEDIGKSYYHDFKYLYFDTESTTDGEIHVPYMICSEERGDYGEKKCFIGDFCIINWLKSLRTNYICFAKNPPYISIFF